MSNLFCSSSQIGVLLGVQVGSCTNKDFPQSFAHVRYQNMILFSIDCEDFVSLWHTFFHKWTSVLTVRCASALTLTWLF